MNEEYSGPTIVKFPEIDISNIPQTLRNIADEIESNEFGKVRNAVIVLDTEALNVFCLGKECLESRAHWLLTAGAFKLMQPFLIDTGVLPQP